MSQGRALKEVNFGSTPLVSASITRPSDTNAYTAKDVISNSTSAPTILTFANAARIAGEGGYIVKARIVTSQSTNVATYRLHLFHTAITMINDNAPYTLLYANRTSRIGYIDFAAAATEGSGSDAAYSLNSTIRLAYTTAAGSKDIYGILETTAAFTPASAQTFFIELQFENN